MDDKKFDELLGKVSAGASTSPRTVNGYNFLYQQDQDSGVMIMNSITEKRWSRVWRILLSIFVLALPVSAIMGLRSFAQVSAFVPLTAYGVYVCGSAVLLAMIAGNLFAMHGMRRYSSSIFTWFLVAALLALPLAAANTIADWIAMIERGSEPGFVKIVLAVVFYLLLAPILFIAEGITSFALVFARRVQGQKSP